VVEVGEQRVVGPGEAVEAGGVGARQLDVALQRGRELREVVLRARDLPDVLTGRGRLRQLGGQLARDALAAVVAAARDAQQVAVDLSQLVGDALQLVEPAADLVGRPEVVVQARERPELVGARLAPGARHHRALVPGGEVAEQREVGELGEPGAEGVEGGGHGPTP